MLAPVQTADAIVVLGCPVGPGRQPSPALRRRIELGARAFHEGAAAWIVVSGGMRWGEVAEAPVMREGLLELGVPDEAITMEARSLSTRGNCRLVAPIVRARGGRRVMVATCHWHLPRAMAGFRRVGLEPVPPPSAWLVGPPARPEQRAREWLAGWVDAAIARISPPTGP
ncbi:MAG TPA: YdcF family protein [Polyangiaceae bacterium]|nr:YdcF family protein [Polyangiaceae bacterium]